MATKAEDIDGDLKKPALLALRMQEGAMSHRRSHSQEAGNSKERNSPTEPSEGTQRRQQ